MPATIANYSAFAQLSELNTLVELGLGKGHGVSFALKGGFSRVFSVDHDKKAVRNARRFFSRDKRVSILRGNVYNPKTFGFLNQLNQPCVFWIDIPTNTPLLLFKILSQWMYFYDSLILVDEWRLRPNCKCHVCLELASFVPREKFHWTHIVTTVPDHYASSGQPNNVMAFVPTQMQSRTNNIQLFSSALAPVGVPAVSHLPSPHETQAP